jgi:predicted  nucleic acid-binding Zn ribbon protein
MFSFEYHFFPDAAHGDAVAFFDGALAAFLAALYRNGQVLDTPWNLVEDDGAVRWTCIAPAADALDPSHYNDACRSALAGVEAASRRPPEYRLLGRTLGSEDPCGCPDPGWYFLITHFLAERPPVRCGDCRGAVPLYRLPFVRGEEEHAAVLSWEAVYQACDTLWIGSGVGERFGYRQMARFDSPLTQEGRTLCAELAAATGKPFYYYLNKFSSRQRERCPGCGGDWGLDRPLFGRYDYRCDRCCLLSVEPL